MNNKNTCRIFRLFSFILPITIIVVYFVCKGITPFGDSAFLIHDMDAQYIDFFAYMRSVISGENNFIYSFSRGLGGDFRSFFAYYLTSPFNLITILFPDELMLIGVSIEMMLLFGLSGLSCYYSLEYFTQKKDGYTLLFFSTAYALSGWMLINAENFQFVPESAVLPMVIVSCHKMKTTGKMWTAIIWLTVSVILNFYIGYMIFIFVFLWLILPDGNKFSPKYIIVFIAAALLSFPIWFPVLRQLKYTVKNYEADWYEPVFNYSVIPFLKKFLPGQFDHAQYRDNGLPAVYCSLITVISAVLYFVSPGNSASKRHRGILILILLVSLLFQPLTMIWQGFSKPHWWPYRFSFLLIYLLILCAASFDPAAKIRIPWLIGLTIGYAGIIFNMFITFDVKLERAGLLSEYTETITQKKAMLGTIPISDELFRIEETTPRNDNDAMHFSYSGITHFDSLANQSVFDFLHNMGFPQDRYTVQYGLGNTEFANSLLGVRFILGKDTVLQREISSSLAYFVPKSINDKLPVTEDEDPAEFQNNLADSLGSFSGILTPVEIPEASMENIECNDIFCSKTDMNDDAYFIYEVSIPEGKALYAHVDESFLVGKLYFLIDGEKILITSPDRLIPLKKAEDSEITEVKILVESAISDKPLINFYAEDAVAVNELFSQLITGIVVKKISSSELQITFPQTSETKMLLVTIPYDSRWKAVSGNDVLRTDMIWDTFLGVEIPGRSEKVELIYR